MFRNKIRPNVSRYMYNFHLAIIMSNLAKLTCLPVIQDFV